MLHLYFACILPYHYLLNTYLVYAQQGNNHFIPYHYLPDDCYNCVEYYKESIIPYNDYDILYKEYHNFTLNCYNYYMDYDIHYKEQARI